MNLQGLLKQLQRFLARYVPERRQLPVLLASFCLSLILWVLVTLADQYQTRIDVNVRIGADNTVVVNHDPDYQVSVGLEGTGLDLLLEHVRLRRDTIHLEFEPSLLELRNLQVEDHLDLFSRSFGAQVSIQNIYPNLLPIDFALKDRKRVPVRMVTNISLPPGFQLAAPPLLQQDSVWIIGAAETIDSITAWNTLAGASALVEDKRDISIPLDTGRNISTDPSEIPVSVFPVPYTEWQLNLPVSIVGMPIGTSVRRSHQEMTLFLTLPQRMKDSLIQSGGFPLEEFEVPYAELVRRGRVGWKPTNDLLPPGIRIISTRPDRIGYSVIRQQSSLN